ncbi:flagellar hook-associated protein FlgL [Mesobacillus zeae]|uniref:Flagellar hook-associated protein FlgL n=1 Tax=Mesobacillus zeae TaxID=1917180 RepID=A0A398B4M3_9BACI|nr:flagellar hook-associated protein FlgL [Mesobacillus zeae]RID84865.1 flagellar hook-associated protein FlgL [Mesobacillus zeae]
MRITQSMVSNNSLKNLSESYRRMDKYQEQLATGKKITRPSDDPVVAMKGMFYRSNLSEVEQFKRNLSELYLWMENSEAGIEQTNKGLQRVRELVIQGKNGTLNPEDKKAVATEIEQIQKDIVSIANSQVAGRYIFHGTDTDHPPVADGIPPQVAANINDPNIQNYNVEVSRGVSLKANINPSNVFGQELFDTLTKIQAAMDPSSEAAQKFDPATLNFDDLLKDLDKAMGSLSSERSELGARYNRLEMVDERIAHQEVMANRVLSDNEDADVERVIVDLKVQETVHRAALGVGARIIQPTLMDFLR